jgi:hypothetical protein
MNQEPRPPGAASPGASPRVCTTQQSCWRNESHDLTAKLARQHRGVFSKQCQAEPLESRMRSLEVHRVDLATLAPRCCPSPPECSSSPWGLPAAPYQTTPGGR